jgi:2-succinyl-6-hydroxy-2,4-cyclohexadiene-1-carboxylate synthase
VRAAVAVDQRRNDPVDLAAALRGMGPAASEPLWDRLGEISMPTEVLAGGRDQKYLGLGERLAAGLPRAALSVVAEVGHRLALEAPRDVVAACRRVASIDILPGR